MGGHNKAPRGIYVGQNDDWMVKKSATGICEDTEIKT